MCSSSETSHFLHCSYNITATRGPERIPHQPAPSAAFPPAVAPFPSDGKRCRRFGPRLQRPRSRPLQGNRPGSGRRQRAPQLPAAAVESGADWASVDCWRSLSGNRQVDRFFVLSEPPFGFGRPARFNKMAVSKSFLLKK